MPRRTLRLVLFTAIAALLALAGCGGDSESEEPSEPFEPQASLTAIGGTQRADKPELAMRAKARPGDTNIRSAAVTLPAAFIVDQAAIGDICSERELKADSCAGRQRMGTARVVSPAFAKPLTGPVYAVSGSGGLPRLAYVLAGGPAEILLRGRIEVEGVRIKANVEDVPDTPLQTFELTIDGGKSGYLILSRDICRAPASANVSFASQEGERLVRRIPLRADCGGQ